MKKYYFSSKNDEVCYPKSHFEDVMEMQGLQFIVVYEAVPDIIGGGVFWCNEHLFCGDNSFETCGKYNCDEYEPRNNKNGRCRHHNIWLHRPGKLVALYRKPAVKHIAGK